MKLGTFMEQLDSAVALKEVKDVSAFLDTLVPMGLSFVDVSTNDVKERPPRYLLELLQEKGVYIQSVFHLFAFDNVDEKKLEQFQEQTKQNLELCCQLGAKMYMPVPVVNIEHEDRRSFLDMRKRFAQYLFDTEKLGNACGVQTVLENFSSRKNPNATVEDIAYLLDEVYNVKYVLDTGNYWFTEDNVLVATEKFLSRTVHIHLKDIQASATGRLHIGKKKGESVAIGEGETPIRDVLKILQKSGYQGGLTVEINHAEKLSCEIATSLENIKNMLKD